MDLSIKKISLIFALLLLGASLFGQNKEKEYLIKAKQSSSKHDYLNAVVNFSKALSLNPKNWKTYYDRGRAKYSLQDYRGAISDYSNALKLSNEVNSTKVDLYQLTILAEVKMKDYDSIILTCNKVIAIDPKNGFAYINRAHSQFQLKNFKQAMADFDKAISVEKETSVLANYFLSRGMAWIILDRKEQACLDFSKAGELGNKEAYENIKEYCQ